LDSFLQHIYKQTHIRKVLIDTHTRPQLQEEQLKVIMARSSARGVEDSVSFVQDLHHRELIFSNGVTISSDRGLDYRKPPNIHGDIQCRSCTVRIFEASAKVLVRQSDVVAPVAKDAAAVLQNTVAE